MEDGKRSDLLSLIVDNSPDAVVLIDAVGNVMTWGAAAERIFGWSADECMGKPIDELLAADGVEGGLTALWDKVKEEGQARGVVSHRHKDGSLLCIEVSWRAVHDTNGELKCVVANKRDVTKEVVARDGKAVSDVFGSLLDSLPDAAIVVNDVGLMILSNLETTKLFGWQRAELMGKSIEILMPGGFRSRHVGHRIDFQKAPERRRVIGIGRELIGRRQDGSEFELEVGLSELSAGGRTFVMCSVRDMTERRLVEAAWQDAETARKANTAKTQFLSRMSHELRTPLNAIIGFSQLLEMDEESKLTSKQRGLVRHISKAGKHLLHMIYDLLDVSRIEADTMSMVIADVDVSAVIAESVALTQRAAEEAGVKIKLDMRPGEVTGMADRVRLRQVLMNLMTNAIKYNKANGEVQVSAWGEDGQVMIHVSDTGIGMSAAQIERMNIPFNRRGVERWGFEGQGVGLMIARGLTEKMGGSLGVVSKEGVGSTFTVALKSADASLAHEIEVRRPIWSSQAHPIDVVRRRVVYVEDDEMNVELMMSVMSMRPEWSVLAVRSAEEAIAEINRERPELLIIDMHLPDMSGIDMVRSLEKDTVTASIPRIALSADAMDASVRKALDAGFSRYFTKPLEITKFLEYMDEMAAGSSGWERSH